MGEGSDQVRIVARKASQASRCPEEITGYLRALYAEIQAKRDKELERLMSLISPLVETHSELQEAMVILEHLRGEC